MPHFMVEVLSDRLRLLNGGKVVYESLYSVDWDQTGLTGTKDEKMRQLEDRVRPILQRGIEVLIPTDSLSPDDPDKTSPVWPAYKESSNLVTRIDTIDVRINNLDPLDYIIWVGRADIHSDSPAGWWAR